MNNPPNNTIIIRHPTRLRKSDLAEMLEYKRSDHMTSFMEAEILPVLKWKLKQYKKITLFTKVQTKQILTILFQLEFLTQEAIDLVVKNNALTQLGQTTITIE